MSLFTGKSSSSSGKPVRSSSNKASFIGVQAKLMVNQPNDSHEREADSVADTVVSTKNAAPSPIRKYVPSTAAVQLSEESVQRKETADAPGITPAFQQGLGGQSGKGVPLSNDVREEMESGIGADFSDVRIHNNDQSHQLSDAIQAKAFTHGNDIYFNQGQYDPGNQAGKHLLAHELTHTVQQGASGQMIQRDPEDDGDPKVTFVIAIPQGMPSKQAFRRYAELQIFGRVINLAWTAAPETEEIYKDITRHYGESVTFEVSQSTLDLYKTAKKDSKTADAAYEGLEGESKNDITKEIDERYYESTGVAPGTKIDPNDKGSVEIWNDFKRQVMEQKQLLDQLPPEVKEFLHIEKGASPDDYEQLAKIAELLQQFTTADFLEYKAMVNFETTDLEELRRSIADYLERKKQRQEDLEQRETIKTKLYGLEELYKRYRFFKMFLEGQPEKMEPDEGFETEEFKKFKQGWIDYEQAVKQELTDSLIANGFSGLDEFGKYIADYEKAFEKETVAIAEDHLLRYRHLLFEEEKKINDDKYISSLFEALTKSGAKAHYDEADSKDSQANGIMRDLGGYAKGDVELKSKLRQEASSERAMGASAIENLPSELVKEDGFDKEEFASISSKDDLKDFLQSYLDEKKESVDETWADIHAHPDHIYELDKLLAASMQAQQIEKDSIYELIIRDKADRINGFKILKAICFVVIAIALTVVTFGAAAPVVATVAGTASLGLSLYGVYEAVEDYKRQNAANDVGLLTDDPSLVWVVLAIAGAAIDTAALASAFKAAKPLAEATKAFNETGDLVKLEKDLAVIADLNAQVRSSVMKAAKARADAKAMLKSVFKPSGGVARMVILPGGEEFAKLVAAGYYLVKSKVYDFNAFILEIKALRAATESAEFTAEELTILKRAFERGKQIKGYDKYFVDEIEKAIAEGNFTRLKEVLDEVDEVLKVNWNLGSSKTFGHTFIVHGKKQYKALIDRARTTKKPQGCWANEELAAEAIRKNWSRLVVGENIIDIPPGAGRVIQPDGTVIENVTKAVVVKNPPGEMNLLKTGYPKIID